MNTHGEHVGVLSRAGYVNITYLSGHHADGEGFTVSAQSDEYGRWCRVLGRGIIIVTQNGEVWLNGINTRVPCRGKHSLEEDDLLKVCPRGEMLKTRLSEYDYSSLSVWDIFVRVATP